MGQKTERCGEKKRGKDGGALREIGRVGDDKESQIKPPGWKHVPERSDQSR